MGIVERIMAANTEKYGKICKNEDCRMHEVFCRCKNKTVEYGKEESKSTSWIPLDEERN